VNPANAGAKVTFTAFVTPATASGKVTFNDGKNQIASATLKSGSASFSTTSLSAGSHSITAIYAGDNKNAPSTSAAVVEVIKGATDIRAINHVVIMLQENRSFDHYFGGLNDYRVANGLPPNVDIATTANFNPGYNGAPPVHFYKLNTVCTEAPSPSWNEAHVDYNRNDPAHGPGLNDGFVQTAAGDARDDNKAGVKPQFHDIDGVRVMGHYTEKELPYYYFMATMFAISDRFFSPIESRTLPNRLYLFAATSAGHAYQPKDTLKSKTIFQELDDAGISWKIYTVEKNGTYFNNFTYAFSRQANVVSINQYFTDLNNNTLPAVSLIEGGYESGLDEHPASNIQPGAKLAASFIDAFMRSQAWQDGVFLFSYDEDGGYYDHVPSPPAAQPDGIAPVDLLPGDIPGNFDRYGYRLPMIVISPFAKRGYVSHTIADYTAFLKFIETRWNLPALTKRDASQGDMTEFFDFANPPWMTPPDKDKVPVQPTNGPCYFDKLP
jgi:phospholipase C